MALPELVRKTIEKELTRYCRDRIIPCPTGQARLHFKIRGETVTLFQEHTAAPPRPSLLATPVAQFRYSHELNQWTLHYPRQDNRWCFYLNAGPDLDFRKLLRHLDEDPLHLFWE